MGTGYTKKYYKVREVAEILGVAASTLRYWETEFPEIQPKRTPHNQRLYTPKDLETLEIIKFLLYTKGLKVEAAKEYLRNNRHNISKKIEVLDKLKNVREELEMLLKSLNLRGQKIGIEPQSTNPNS